VIGGSEDSPRTVDVDPIHIYDPGGHVKVMEETLFALLPSSRRKSVVVREGLVVIDGVNIKIPKITQDTGASHASYIGTKMLERMPQVKRYPCKHSAKLGDGKTILEVKEYCVLYIQLLDDYGCPTEPMHTELFLVDGLGEEVIIGLPDILGAYFNFFVAALTNGRNGTKLSVMSEFEQVCLIMEGVQREVARSQPRRRAIARAQRKLSTVLSKYDKRKDMVLKDPMSVRVIYNDPNGVSHEVVTSRRYGSVVDNDVFHDSVLYAIESCSTDAPSIPAVSPEPGFIIDPWAEPPDTSCPEIDETPDPLSFSEDVLRFMELSHSDALAECHEMLPLHVSPEMSAVCPQVNELLKSYRCFCSSSMAWYES